MVKHVRFASTVVLVSAIALMGCTTPHHPADPPPKKGKAPVIFVHGYAENGAMWDVAVAHFTANGYTAENLVRFDYPSVGEGAVDAAGASERLAGKVDEVRRATGAHRVDIVAHSLGNLVTKHCIVEGGCRGKIAHWGNIAGAQNGTEIASQCTDPACADMLPGSALITRLQAADDKQIAAQHVKVQVHWTPNDGIIVPPEASKEPYAQNIQVSETLDHFTIFVDTGVLQDTVTFFAG
jgi:triacylglycerol lipase